MSSKEYIEDGKAKVEFAGEQKKIFLIGDSIREGYCEFVKDNLKDKYEVIYPFENCRNTQFVITSLYNWSNRIENPATVEAVTFNCGHWDVAHMYYDESTLTSESEYAQNIKKIVRLLKTFFPNAKLIFFTTTPGHEENMKSLSVNPRSNEEIERFNQLATEVCEKENVLVEDLYKVVKEYGDECFKDYCHLKEEYSEKLGEHISNFLLSVLNK